MRFSRTALSDFHVKIMNMANLLSPRWLDWAREIQALGQTGVHYALNVFDRDRYNRLLKIAAEIIAEHTSLPQDELLKTFGAQKGNSTPKIDVRAAVFRDVFAVLADPSLPTVFD